MLPTEVDNPDYCEIRRLRRCGADHKLAQELTIAEARDKVTDVAVGIVTGGLDKILIAQRQQHQKLASFWEFPGGKMLSRESAYCALRRELTEEVNIHTQSAYPLLDYLHRYDHAMVHLHFWHVTQFTGQVYGVEGQHTEWINTDQIGNYQFPVGNQAVIALIANGSFHNKSC